MNATSIDIANVVSLDSADTMLTQTPYKFNREDPELDDHLMEKTQSQKCLDATVDTRGISFGAANDGNVGTA